MRSVPPRGSGCVKTKQSQQDGSMVANLQVRKGGLPPLERRRRDYLTIAFMLKRHRSSLRVLHSKAFPFVAMDHRNHTNRSRRWRSSGGKPPFLTCKLPHILEFHTVSVAGVSQSRTGRESTRSIAPGYKLNLIGHRHKNFCQFIQPFCILVIEPAKHRTVEIEHTNQLLILD
jgi:hypothetical protein